MIPIPPRPKLKPYYDDGKGIIIYHGDNRVVMPKLGRFDLILTDPQYGINAGNKIFKNGTRKSKAIYQYGEWDNSPPDLDFMNKIFSYEGKVIVFGGNYFHCPPSRCWLVWNKQTGNNSYADAELAWTNFDAVVRIFGKHWSGSNAKEKKELRLHATQKPVALMGWCIGLAGEVKSILDPFAGSGTTAIAAKQRRIECTLIEREESNCEIAALRLSQDYLI